MKDEQIEQWLTYEEAVKCAFGDHTNHKHPDEEKEVSVGTFD